MVILTINDSSSQPMDFLHTLFTFAPYLLAVIFRNISIYCLYFKENVEFNEGSVTYVIFHPITLQHGPDIFDYEQTQSQLCIFVCL
jgi:hypothetical protein